MRGIIDETQMLNKTNTLWVLAILAAVGDMGTTLYGLNNGYTEGNPLMSDMMDEHGETKTMLVSKVAPLLLGFGISKLVVDEWEWVVPLSVVLVWWPVVLFNLSLLLRF